MAWSKGVASSSATNLVARQFPSFNSFSLPSSPFFVSFLSTSYFPLIYRKKQTPLPPPLLFSISSHKRNQLCRAAEYEFPDPIPEFAEAETEKFKEYLLAKLTKKDLYGGSVKDVLGICTEIFSTFLNTEYGGPGTLLVVPFIDMADTINERGLPGGPQAARAAVVWAQKNVDKDWNEWTGADDN